MYMKRHYCNIPDEETHCILRTMLMHTGVIEMIVHIFITVAVRIFPPVANFGWCIPL